MPESLRLAALQHRVRTAAPALPALTRPRPHPSGSATRVDGQTEATCRSKAAASGGSGGGDRRQRSSALAEAGRKPRHVHNSCARQAGVKGEIWGGEQQTPVDLILHQCNTSRDVPPRAAGLPPLPCRCAVRGCVAWQHSQCGYTRTTACACAPSPCRCAAWAWTAACWTLQ